MKLIRGVDDDKTLLYKEKKSLLDNTKLKELFEKKSLEYNAEIYGSSKQARSLDDLVVKLDEISPMSTGGTHTSRQIHDMSSIALRVSRSLLDDDPNSQTQLEQLQAPDSFCPYDKETYDTCNVKYAYRSYDGTCNNVNYVWWGKSETPFKRILTPLYDDGLNGPRARSVNGGLIK